MISDLYYRNFENNTNVRSDENGYYVGSTKKLMMGDLIEECPSKPVESKMEVFYTGDIPTDEPLLDGLIPNPPRPNSLTGLSLVGGNFSMYRRSKKFNAIYIFDPRFSVVTIRAISPIAIGDEIILEEIVNPNEPKDVMDKETKDGKKVTKRGCGCGKNKPKVGGNKKNASTVSDEELRDLYSRGPKVLRGKAPRVGSDERKAKPEFKSMVEGGELKSIEVEK